jgi:hypothetical protein
MTGKIIERAKPLIDEALVRLHDAASSYAVAVNAAIVEQFNGNHPYPLAGGALYRLEADIIAFHQALLALCATGWVSCSAPILRTLLDLLLSTAIIVELHEEAEIRGFRCTHFFLKVTLRSTDANDELHKDCRRQIDSGIARLSGSDQEKARRFIFKERVSGYWYAPEYYHRPQEAADKLLPPEMARYYATLSSAAHGGFFGLGLFRDQPDLIHPNPRNDPRAQSLALCTSIRLVLETAHARDQFELDGQLSTVYRRLIERLSKVH